jgi:hypothetical protein
MQFDQKAHTDQQDDDRDQEVNVRNNRPSDLQKAHLIPHRSPPSETTAGQFMD